MAWWLIALLFVLTNACGGKPIHERRHRRDGALFVVRGQAFVPVACHSRRTFLTDISRCRDFARVGSEIDAGEPRTVTAHVDVPGCERLPGLVIEGARDVTFATWPAGRNMLQTIVPFLAATEPQRRAIVALLPPALRERELEIRGREIELDGDRHVDTVLAVNTEGFHAAYAWLADPRVMLEVTRADDYISVDTFTDLDSNGRWEIVVGTTSSLTVHVIEDHAIRLLSKRCTK